MKKLLIAFLVMAVLMCGCAAKQTQPEPQQTLEPETAAEPEAEEAPAFNLETYKSAVNQFRRDVMDNTVNVGNIVNYESGYISSYQKIDGGSPKAEKVVEAGYKWFEEKSGRKLSDIDLFNDSIRTQYAELIITEIEGKEAEELDSYVRTMYDGYNTLYTMATTGTPTSYESFVLAANDALTSVNDANSNISLFCGEYPSEE